MDPETKRILEETHALAKDSHRMLRSVRRHQLITDFGKFIVWIVIIAVAFFGYQQYLKPLVDSLSATGVFSSPTSADIQKLIDSYKAGQ